MISSKLGNFLADQGISNDTKWYQMTVPLKVAPYIFRCLLESFFKAQGMFKSLALSRMFDWKASNKCDIESIKYISIYYIVLMYCIFPFYASLFPINIDGRLCLMIVPFSSCGVERANSTHHLQGIFSHSTRSLGSTKSTSGWWGWGWCSVQL